jgi:glycosyltransferase involved in cell wall biosynthesis
MKITYLIPGSGGTFYCGNCHRDMLYVNSLNEVEGFEVNAIPLYLLPDRDNFGDIFEENVFFGAVSVYLKEKAPFFRQMPPLVDKILDSDTILKFAAKRAGTTTPEGFETTTLNMIRGDSPAREKETDRLVKHIIENGKPDIIHISNALIIGLASQLKQKLNIPVICSLQNEDDWIEEMREPYKSDAWKLIGQESVNIDHFISTSNYFKDFIIKNTGIDPDKISVIPSLIEITNTDFISENNDKNSLGYFSRLSKMNGLDKLIDAFLILKKDGIPDLELHLCGGYTGSDKQFINEHINRIKDEGFADSLHMYNSFTGMDKQRFFNNIKLMSVPVRKHDAYGLYLLEAISAGVPVVQPATGAFPEIIENTGGGITYNDDTPEQLATTILGLINDKQNLDKLRNEGIKRMKENLSSEKMAKMIIEVYKATRIT